MSVEKNYFVIAGCDLTDTITDTFEDWTYTDRYDDYRHNQIKGEVQLFDDPMSGRHLYLGYILAAGDEYECNTEKFTVDDIQDKEIMVREKLNELISLGVVKGDQDYKYQVIAFEECH